MIAAAAGGAVRPRRLRRAAGDRGRRVRALGGPPRPRGHAGAPHEREARARSVALAPANCGWVGSGCEPPRRQGCCVCPLYRGQLYDLSLEQSARSAPYPAAVRQTFTRPPSPRTRLGPNPATRTRSPTVRYGPPASRSSTIRARADRADPRQPLELAGVGEVEVDAVVGRLGRRRFRLRGHGDRLRLRRPPQTARPVEPPQRRAEDERRPEQEQQRARPATGRAASARRRTRAPRARAPRRDGRLPARLQVSGRFPASSTG